MSPYYYYSVFKALLFVWCFLGSSSSSSSSWAMTSSSPTTTTTTTAATSNCPPHHEEATFRKQSQSCTGANYDADDDDDGTTSTTSKTISTCQDEHEECSYWAMIGECHENPTYMWISCRTSCGLCTNDNNYDFLRRMSIMEKDSDDSNESMFGNDLGIPQILTTYLPTLVMDTMDDTIMEIEAIENKNMEDYDVDVDNEYTADMEKDMEDDEQDSVWNIFQQAVEKIQQARHYMRSVIDDNQNLCRNKHEMCTLWGLLGECETNPGYMKIACAPICRSCEYVTIVGRCSLDPNAKEVWKKPGDLNTFFRQFTSKTNTMMKLQNDAGDPNQQPSSLLHEYRYVNYPVQVLSSPDPTSDDEQPWLIIMDNVITQQEAERLIELGDIEGYQRSKDVVNINNDGTWNESIHENRTSTNAWCQHQCYQDPIAQQVIHRLSTITGIPETNSEYLQLLKYETGQFYGIHHDYIHEEKHRQQGARILTVYIYLNNVRAGGGTNFPQLNLTVMPKLGRAVLWPNVYDFNPYRMDPRTFHQALPVEAGVKYGANAWFHMRDFKTPHRIGCQR